MELELHNADPAGYDASVFLEDLAEYAACRLNESETEIRYDIPGHADGMRLLVRSCELCFTLILASSKPCP